MATCIRCGRYAGAFLKVCSGCDRLEREQRAANGEGQPTITFPREEEAQELADDVFRPPVTGAPSMFDRLLGATGALGKEAAMEGVGSAGADFDLYGQRSSDASATARRARRWYRWAAILVAAPFGLLTASVFPRPMSLILTFTLFPWLIWHLGALIGRFVAWVALKDHMAAVAVMRSGARPSLDELPAARPDNIGDSGARSA